jgi:hypothetical protein
MTERRGTCCCGQLNAICTGDAARISMCSCEACQRRTGVVFSTNSRFRREQVRIEGRSTVFSRTADSGNGVSYHFCPECGTTVYWELEGFPDLIAIATGTFADPTYPPPTVSVWERGKHPWIDRIADVGMEHLE